MHVNDGIGGFTDTLQMLGATESFGIELGDLDDDGDLDALFANASSQANRVFTNDGAGVFSDSLQMLGGNNSRDVDLGDVDGDGDLDALFANESGQANRVFTNDGSGLFFDSAQTLGANTSQGIRLGDVDGDGDADALVSNVGQPNRIYLNDGAGVFSDSLQMLDGNNSWYLSAGDLDADGDLDILFANDPQPNSVWFNDCLADLSLDKTVSATNAQVGQTLNYTLTLTNLSAESITTVIITDALPAEVTYVSDSSAECVLTNGDVVCDFSPLGSFSPSGGTSITINVTGSMIGRFTNFATVIASSPDPGVFQ